jgi:hypothetical protein
VVLAAYANRSGVPTYLGAVDLGHATRVDQVSIHGGIVSVSGANVGPNFEDPFCCPNHPFASQFRFEPTGVVDVSCAATASGDAAPPAIAWGSDGAAAPSAGTVEALPATLTEHVRADILAAVERANTAWAAASQSLDPSGLSAGVAGQELADDLAELDKLRSQGQTRNNVNTAFAVTDVALDAPGHATVRTRETWYAEIHAAASGRLLQRTPAVTYDETDTVEYLNGGWIVTLNELHG